LQLLLAANRGHQVVRALAERGAKQWALVRGVLLDGWTAW